MRRVSIESPDDAPSASGEKLLALVEVALVLFAFVALGRWLRGSGFMAWQSSNLGASFLSNAALFLLLPALTITLRRLDPGRYGLASAELGRHFAVGARVGAILLPATMLFGLVGFLELDPKGWRGAAILAGGFAIAGAIALLTIARGPRPGPGKSPGRAMAVMGCLLTAGLIAGVLVKSSAPILTRTLYVLLFVALLEELFFRGYLQQRLNDVFELPYRLFGTRFGPGLVLSGLVFGLFHPLMSSAPGDGPWALWTGVIGLVFGFVREKTGSAVASSIAHGIILLPMVAFGG